MEIDHHSNIQRVQDITTQRRKGPKRSRLRSSRVGLTTRLRNSDEYTRVAMTTPWRFRSCFPTTKLAASWKPSERFLYLRRRNRNHKLSSWHEQLTTLLDLSPCIFLSALFRRFRTMMCSDLLIFRSSKSRVAPRSLASVVIHSTSLSAIPTSPLINASTPHQIHPASLGFVPRQQNDVISLGQHAKDRAARKRIPKFLVVQVPSPGSAITSGTWLSIDSDGAWITPLLISTSGATFPSMIGPTFSSMMYLRTNLCGTVSNTFQTSRLGMQHCQKLWLLVGVFPYSAFFLRYFLIILPRIIQNHVRTSSCTMIARNRLS